MTGAEPRGRPEDDDEAPTRVNREPTEHAGPEEASLVVIHGPDLGRRYRIDRASMELGRGEGNAVHVASDMASRTHARVFEAEGCLWLEDLGSTNGTLVNNERVQRRALANGDIINIGSVLLKFISGGHAEALYHEEIYRMTITDNLTGLANRRYLLDFLDRELARALRYERPLSLGLLDIDQFKQLNDRYGHLAGDFVLRELGSDISGFIRREELLARYGGEEFALVMPETAIEGARTFGERIRRRVEASTFDVDGCPAGVTISMGLATVPEPSVEDIDTFLKRADDCLYRAKCDGRNRVRTTVD